MGNQCKGSDELGVQESSNKQLHPTMGKRKPRLADYKKINKLGQGAYGTVYLVENDSNQYAMKEILKSRIKKASTKRHIDDERKILAAVKSDYLVELKVAFQDETKLYLIVNYVAGGELFYHLRKEGRFPVDVARFYAAEILMALIDLHKQNIIYRDLKPENILLELDGHIKLTDFGLCKFLDDDRAYSMCGTPEYLAPEVVTSKEGYSFEADFYSFVQFFNMQGCVVYEMLVGHPPFYSANKREMFQNRLNKKIPFPELMDKVTQTFLQGLLQLDPNQRFKINDIKNHDFFRLVNFEELRQVTPPYAFDGQEYKYFQQFNKTTPTLQVSNIQFQFPGFTYEGHP